MSELVVPLVILGVILLILILNFLISKKITYDPQLPMKFAESHNLKYTMLESYAISKHTAAKYEIKGDLNHVPLHIEVAASRGRSLGFAKLIVEIPNLPQSLSITRTVSFRQALKRGRLPDRHDATLALIWQVEGADVSTIQRLTRQTGHNLTNLFVAYPHARIQNQQIYIEKAGHFGSDLENLANLATLIGHELNSL